MLKIAIHWGAILVVLALSGCDKATFAPLVIDRDFAGIYRLAEATPILEEVPCQVVGQDGKFQLLEIGANTINHYFSTVLGSTDCLSSDKVGARFYYLVDETSDQPATEGAQRLKTAIFHHYIRVVSASAANTLNLEGACNRTDWVKGEYDSTTPNYVACRDATPSQLGRYITKPPRESDYRNTIIELTPANRGISFKTQRPSATSATLRYFILRR